MTMVAVKIKDLNQTLHQNALNSNTQLHVNVPLCTDCQEGVIGLGYQKSKHILTHS